MLRLHRLLNGADKLLFHFRGTCSHRIAHDWLRLRAPEHFHEADPAKRGDHAGCAEDLRHPGFLRFKGIPLRSGLCLAFPRRDPACDTRCAESDTGAARFGPVCPGHGTPEWRCDRRRGVLADPRRAASHRGEWAPRPSLPTLAPRASYDRRCDPDHVLLLADPSASGQTRANARRRKTPSTPASESVHVPILCSRGLAYRYWRTRTRCPRSRLSPCLDIARPGQPW